MCMIQMNPVFRGRGRGRACGRTRRISGVTGRRVEISTVRTALIYLYLYLYLCPWPCHSLPPCSAFAPPSEPPYSLHFTSLKLISSHLHPSLAIHQSDACDGMNDSCIYARACMHTCMALLNPQATTQNQIHTSSDLPSPSIPSTVSR